MSHGAEEILQLEPILFDVGQAGGRKEDGDCRPRHE
jgi:hypothetical protein